jgi:hypothetical protein
VRHVTKVFSTAGFAPDGTILTLGAAVTQGFIPLDVVVNGFDGLNPTLGSLIARGAVRLDSLITDLIPKVKTTVSQMIAISNPPTQNALTSNNSGGFQTINTAYYYVVTVVNGTGDESMASNEQTLTTSGGTNTYVVTVHWNAVAGATGYRIYRGLSPGGENTLAGTVGVTTSFADGQASPPAGSPPSSPPVLTIQAINYGGE